MQLQKIIIEDQSDTAVPEDILLKLAIIMTIFQQVNITIKKIQYRAIDSFITEAVII